MHLTMGRVALPGGGGPVKVRLMLSRDTVRFRPQDFFLH